MCAHNVLLQLCEFSYVALPFGIATASTIRVGNMLGAGRPEIAKRSGASPDNVLYLVLNQHHMVLARRIVSPTVHLSMLMCARAR